MYVVMKRVTGQVLCKVLCKVLYKVVLLQMEPDCRGVLRSRVGYISIPYTQYLIHYQACHPFHYHIHDNPASVWLPMHGLIAI